MRAPRVLLQLLWARKPDCLSIRWDLPNSTHMASQTAVEWGTLYPR